MTIDDAIAALCKVPRLARPGFIKTSDMLLRCWLHCRNDPEFRKQIYEKHDLESRILHKFFPATSGEDRLIVLDAYGYFEAVYRDHIVLTEGCEHKREQLTKTHTAVKKHLANRGEKNRKKDDRKT